MEIRIYILVQVILNLDKKIVKKLTHSSVHQMEWFYSIVSFGKNLKIIIWKYKQWYQLKSKLFFMHLINNKHYKLKSTNTTKIYLNIK